MDAGLGIKVFCSSHSGIMKALDKISDIKNEDDKYKNQELQLLNLEIYLPILLMTISHIQNKFLNLNFKLIEKG